MKSLLLIVMMQLIILTGCESLINENNSERLVLTCDREIIADSSDVVTMYAELYDDQDFIYIPSGDITYFCNGVEMPYPSFSTLELGEHTFYAVYQNYKSNIVKMNAISFINKPYLRVDHVFSNTVMLSLETNMECRSEVIYGKNGMFTDTLRSNSFIKEHILELKNLDVTTEYSIKVGVISINGDSSETDIHTATTGINSIDVGYIVSDIVVDENLAYAVSRKDKKLLKIDLVNKQVVDSISVVHYPSSLCLSEDKKMIFVVDLTGSITQYTTELTKVSDISWSTENWTAYDEKDEYHFHIEQINNYLYVTDGNWEPELWRINMESLAVENTGINCIGDFIYDSSDSTFYTWYQFGWSAGYAGSDIHKYKLMANDSIVEVDKSMIGYPEFGRDPLDASLFLDKKNSLIYCKTTIFNTDSLSSESVTMDEELGDIYNINFTNNFGVTQKYVYDLTTYRKIYDISSLNLSQTFFTDDDLFIVDRKYGVIYYSSIASFIDNVIQ